MKNRIMMIVIALLFTNTFQANCMQKCDNRLSETTPSSRFEINKEKGEVYDTKTKLTWTICQRGMKYNNKDNCTGESYEYDFGEAKKKFYVSNNDAEWRLPSVEELVSIVEPRCEKPAINLNIFPGQPEFVRVWTYESEQDNRSIGPREQKTGYMLSTGFGKIHSIDDGEGYYGNVRLVRGKKWVDYEKQTREKQAAQEVANRKILEEKRVAAEAKIRAENYRNKTKLFRKNISLGDETTYGMVIEVKKPLVKIQTTQYVVNHYTEWKTKYNQYGGTYKDPELASQSNPMPVEKWFKIEDVFPIE